ncbi:MAG: hypothetical protein FWF82_07825 [Oscillospiraceae bacterium]|nr:hypothetical protein [Oscillospiraceae bacterium]
MGGKTIGLSFNSGFAGNYARQPDAVIATRANNGSDNIVFGAPVMISGDGVANIDDTLTADTFVGVASSEAKSTLDYSDQNSGGVYVPGSPVSVFQRGSISVACPVDSPSRYGAVYVRTIGATGRNIGDFEAAAVTDENVLITNAQWGGIKDGRNIAELVLLTRGNA